MKSSNKIILMPNMANMMNMFSTTKSHPLLRKLDVIIVMWKDVRVVYLKRIIIMTMGYVGGKSNFVVIVTMEFMVMEEKYHLK